MPDKKLSIKKQPRNRPNTDKVSDPQVRAGHEGVKIIGGGNPGDTRPASEGVDIVKRHR